MKRQPTKWKRSLSTTIIQKIKARLNAIPKCKHQNKQIIQSINGPMNSRHFSKEELHMANKYLTFSPVLAFKEMLIKTSWRVHFIPFRIPIIKRRTRKKTTDAGKEMGKRNPVHCWGECKLVEFLTIEISSKYLKILETKLPYDPWIPFLVACPRTYYNKDTHTCKPVVAVFALGVGSPAWTEILPPV